MDVIELRRPVGTVYSFVDDNGRTVLENWFATNEVPELWWGAIYSLWDIYESFGLRAIAASIVDFEDGFLGLKVPRKGEHPLCPIFCLGPFDEETEITFLIGALWDDRRKRVRPYSAIGSAEENLEILRNKRHRRRRESNA